MGISKERRKRKIDNFDSMAVYRGYVLKSKVLKVLESYHFLSKPKLIREIKRL